MIDGTHISKNEEKLTAQNNSNLKINVKKNPFFALLCSFIFPGLGQVYNGQTVLGVLVLLGAAAFIGISAATFILLIPALIIWIFGMANAGIVAMKMNIGKRLVKSTKTTHVLLFFLAAIIVSIFVFIISSIIRAALSPID